VHLKPQLKYQHDDNDNNYNGNNQNNEYNNIIFMSSMELSFLIWKNTKKISGERIRDFQLK